jgi:peptide/nickel transport system ATP-binding protein/oligopeptide transport system ATP-binding protein
MGVIADVSDRVLVVYAGRIVEDGPKLELFENAQHPYTWGLLGSIPRLDRPKPRRLTTIPGLPPSLIDLPPGCAFQPRCPHRFAACAEPVELVARVAASHHDRCVLPLEERRSRREPTVHPEQR